MPGPGRREAAGIFVAALILYLLTLQPSLAWGDGLRLQQEVITGESFVLTEMLDARFAPDPWPFARLGIAAWDHPLYVIGGHSLLQLLPGVDAPWLVNALSAFFAAAALVALALLLAPHVAHRAAAVVAVAWLGVAHTFWWHATTPEVYSLYLALLLAALVGWDRYLTSRRARPLVLAGLALGLAAATHVLAFLAMPALGAERTWGARARARSRPHDLPRHALTFAVAFLVGFLPYLVQGARMLRSFSVAEVASIASGAAFFGGSMDPAPGALAAIAGLYLGYLLVQLGPVGVALGLAGWWLGRRRAPALWRLALPLYGVYLLFGLAYRVPDQFAFLLTAHVLWAVALALGVDALLARLAPRRRPLAVAALALLVALQGPLYALAPDAARAAGLDEAALGVPEVGTGARDGLRYYLDPDHRGDRSAEVFLERLAAELPEGALVVAHWYADTDELLILRQLTRVEGRRTDLAVLGWTDRDPFAFDPRETLAAVEAAVAERPVYLASLDERTYAAAEIARRWCVRPEHGLWRVRERGYGDGAEGDAGIGSEAGAVGDAGAACVELGGDAR